MLKKLLDKLKFEGQMFKAFLKSSIPEEIDQEKVLRLHSIQISLNWHLVLFMLAWTFFRKWYVLVYLGILTGMNLVDMGKIIISKIFKQLQ